MIRRFVIGAGIATGLTVVIAAVFVLSLPRLYHDGVNADDAALAAMIRGEPVLEVATWKILLRKDYAPEETR